MGFRIYPEPYFYGVDHTPPRFLCTMDILRAEQEI